MRIYLDTVEAIKDIGRELKKCSTEVWTQTMQNKDISKDDRFSTHELQAFEFMVINGDDKDKMPGVTKEWADAEFKERVSKDFVNPGEAYKLREDVWSEFLVEQYAELEQESRELKFKEPKFKFDYTYNDRIMYQLQPVIDELKIRPESRQAIIELHNNKIDLKSFGTKRIPCSMFYHYMLRDGKLDVIYVMRSSDFATHFQNDIYLAIELRNYIASRIGVPPGKFIMFVSSLHIYKKDFDTLKNY